MGVPHKLPPRSEKFVGRTTELDELHARLNRDVAVGVTQQTATHGHGGIGKTALAIEYAWKHLDDYPGGVFFIRCDASSIAVEVATLAVPLETSEAETPEQTARHVVKHLESGPPSLFILDNVDVADQWVQIAQSEFLPGGPCRRLVTTRRNSLRGISMYPLDRLPTDQGVGLLTQYRSDAAKTENAEVVGDVVEWFDGLAVGLTVVGAYMGRRQDLTWSRYRDELNSKGLGAVRSTEDVVQDTRPLDYNKRVDSVFDDLLRTLDPSRRRALEYAALLPADQVMVI